MSLLREHKGRSPNAMEEAQCLTFFSAWHLHVQYRQNNFYEPRDGWRLKTHPSTAFEKQNTRSSGGQNEQIAKELSENINDKQKKE